MLGIKATKKKSSFLQPEKRFISQSVFLKKKIKRLFFGILLD